MRHFSPFQRSSLKANQNLKEADRYQNENPDPNNQEVIEEIQDISNDEDSNSHKYYDGAYLHNNENVLNDERNNNISQKLKVNELKIQDTVSAEGKANNPFHNSTKRFKNTMKKQLIGNPYLEFVTSQMIKNLSSNHSIANKNLMKIYGISKNINSGKKKHKTKQKDLKDIMLLNENE